MKVQRLASCLDWQVIKLVLGEHACVQQLVIEPQLFIVQ